MPKKEIDSQKIEDVRIQTVADFILEGLRPKEIKSYCMENFKVCSRTVDNYITRAKDIIKLAGHGQKNIEFEKAKLMQRFELLFSKCFAYEDYKTCASILKQQSDILTIAGEGEEGGATQLSSLNIVYTDLTVDTERELEELRRFKSEHSK